MRFLIYASISPVVHLVAVGSRHDGNVESIANVTEVGTQGHRGALGLFPPSPLLMRPGLFIVSYGALRALSCHLLGERGTVL